MKFTGDATLHAPVAKVWDALLDPAVLVRTIPGCERLEATGENAYAMTVTAGVAAIKGTYAGSCELSDLQQGTSLVMRLNGAGAPGTIGATVDVGFAENADGTTTVSYDADAVVGGMVGGVGQRMLTSVSRRMAAEFFGNVDGVLTGATPAAAPMAAAGSAASGAVSEPQPGVFVAPAKAPVGPGDDFLKGVLVGAGLVLAGVVVGGLFGAAAVTLDDFTFRPVNDLTVDSTAREMADAVRRREISAVELMELHLARIADHNPELNAIVSLDEDRARSGAAAADAALAAGGPVGPLHGLPFAFKDTHAVAGWRTTYGSPLYADHVPEHDELLVERVRGAGAVPIGKTNVPEFAAGSHTFNTLFGTTLNPVDPTRSAGGSSGGAACALRSGMVPLADGSDMGGSLRNPASFCGVVGLRPSLGRVPEWPHPNAWETTSVGGPMARNVGDLALLLSVLAGPDPRAPLALGDPGPAFAPPLTGSLAGLRVALSEDLGGAFQVDHEVRSVVSSSAAVFSGAGARVAAAHPDLSLADDTFRTLRAWHFQARYGARLAEHPDAFKKSLADNIRAGESLTGADIARAYRQRTALAETMRAFFTDHDVLVLPVSQVPPFPADQEFPTAINGVQMETYLDWMRSAYFITVTGCPAISVPAGHTRDGLPVGIQIVAPHGADRRLLEVAAAFESATGPL